MEQFGLWVLLIIPLLHVQRHSHFCVITFTECVDTSPSYNYLMYKTIKSKLRKRELNYINKHLMYKTINYMFISNVVRIGMEHRRTYVSASKTGAETSLLHGGKFMYGMKWAMQTAISDCFAIGRPLATRQQFQQAYTNFNWYFIQKKGHQTV